ncbi:uncharacterized protein FOMMEDRAFT_116020 [Fomitiporia mediterranea MF3/22]|uniref:uncharacterized protein n=1 Tax=Fomitiporia mediterranea (strain MF3/22) TaxID=694068 RepID=UPI00044085B7|nr:uncharacterized protein FOMMEDRAFT_116020 [Fomitiporia mediterranea MF3/22]EJD07642.1 hypothetical protein FOMMEDRAFT_116020 [Fomitiporia mediterranea MF3/22]
MPADRANHRRTSTDDATRQREQELRRARGEIACIECQRLKLRCDRKVPCASCIRRNRAAMCPNGHAWTDQETRSLLSDTAQLHRKLSEMSQRIRQLEDALEISHSANSSTHHPLLREELLAIKRGVVPPAPPAPEGEPEGDYVEALGTMSISERGVSRFIGRSGGGESLFLLGNDGEQGRAKPFTEELFPQLLSRRSDAWLFMPPNTSAATILSIIEAHMPPFTRASSLCEAYLENFSWILRVAGRPQIVEELLPSCYRGSGPLGGPHLTMTEGETQYGATCIHELALLLMIFAAGALADLTLPPYNDEAERYYQMSLAALSLTRVIGSPTLPAVQTVALMGAYNAHCGHNSTLDLAGSLFALAANMGVSMGLHRDVTKWNICESNADRRRHVFWELFTCDCWHNIANGKPPSFVLRYCDCRYPERGSEDVVKDGRKEVSCEYWRLRHQMSRILYAASDLFSSVQPVRYAQILEIDRMISEFVIPTHLQVPAEGESMEADGPLLIMQRLVPAVCRDGLLMYIHRGFFAKALLEHPADPMLSQHSHSYLSAYRAALSMIKVVREHYLAFPNLVSRFWSLWSHAFSATVIIASIVVKGRDPDTVRTALVELNLAVGLFEKAAQLSDRAKRSLPTLTRFREKAHKAARALGETHSQACLSDVKAPGEYDDELLIFAGKNNIVKPKDEPREVTLASQTSTPPTSSAVSAASVLRSNSVPIQRQFQDQDTLLTRSNSLSQAHNSPHDSTLPPTPEGDGNARSASMNVDLPSAWTAWSDQEALLINYLSSGADLHFAQNAAFTGEPDPSSFMWAEMSTATTPEASSQDSAKLQQQQQQASSGDSSGLFNGMGGVNGQEPSTFVNMPDGGLNMPQSQFQMQAGMTPWDVFF